jgi:hypothetical protein
MNQHHFDSLTRALRDMPTRRRLLGGLAALGLGLGVGRLPQATAVKKQRKRHKSHNEPHNKKQRPAQRGGESTGADRTRLAASPCGPCEKWKKGTCVPKPDGTPCPDGLCQGGVCAPSDTSCGATCPGCCFDGQCYPGDTNANCGKDGAICAQCASDETCTAAGVCGPPPTPICGNGGPCLVFVTSVELSGNLAGLDGADAVCQQLAQANTLPGIFRAWLSDETGSPSTRFTQSPGPYVLRNGTVVANTWADLTDGPLLAPIEITEQHSTVVGGRTWSNTERDGLPLLSNQKHCDNWTSAADPFIGHFGRAFASNAEWTDSGNHLPCEQTAHLYCFQQS